MKKFQRKSYNRTGRSPLSVKLYYVFRYKYGLGVLLHKFRKETHKYAFTYDDFLKWYDRNWHRFHKKPLSPNTLSRALRLFASYNFVIHRIGYRNKKVLFGFVQYKKY